MSDIVARLADQAQRLSCGTEQRLILDAKVELERLRGELEVYQVDGVASLLVAKERDEARWVARYLHENIQPAQTAADLYGLRARHPWLLGISEE